MGFVHLHTHSYYSLRGGVPSVKNLVEGAKAVDASALALTDHNSMAGMVSFVRAMKARWMQPIVGCELSVLPLGERRYRKRIHHLTLLVEGGGRLEAAVQPGPERFDHHADFHGTPDQSEIQTWPRPGRHASASRSMAPPSG